MTSFWLQLFSTVLIVVSAIGIVVTTWWNVRRGLSLHDRLSRIEKQLESVAPEGIKNNRGR